MEFVRRLSTQSATKYPLPLHGCPVWQPVAGGWQTTIELPEVPAKHIIVPSFAILGSGYRYQFSLGDKDARVSESDAQLMSVPPRKSVRPSSNQAYEAKIDCWHTKHSSRPVVTLNLESPHAPDRELLVVSVRPLRMRVQTRPRDKPSKVRGVRPPAISQMMGPRAIAAGICSPTALAMALDGPWPAAIRACYDPQTRAYGCWPLAINWAAERGILGAVEALHDWQDVVCALAHGRPLVCSINFAAGALRGAPRAQTAGHLVVLYGIEDEVVHVMDPAASTHTEVPVEYVREEFMQAWLRDRGAAYIFSN